MTSALRVVEQGDAETLTINQNRIFKAVLKYRLEDQTTVVSLVGHTATAQVRLFAGGPLVANFGVAVDGPNGTITLTLTDTQTTKIKQNSVYDVEVVTPDGPVTFLRGKVRLVPRITT